MRKIRTVLHSFSMGDVEDPYLYAASPIHEWQQTEQGKWVTDHVTDGEFHCVPDSMTYGFRVVISGELSEKDYTFYKLKWL